MKSESKAALDETLSLNEELSKTRSALQKSESQIEELVKIEVGHVC